MNWKDLFPKNNRYFETNNGILYCGDAKDILQQFPSESVDLVLTDPPYGLHIEKMGFTKGGSRSGKGIAKKTIFKNFEDKPITKKYFDEIFRISKNQIIWGGNYYIDYLYSTRCMLVWFKRNNLPIRSFADCEIAWTSFNKNSMVFNCRWDGFIRDSREKKWKHPTQKALELFKWCIDEFTNENDIILDPFIGSGTTAEACEKLNRRWIGIEINPEYCEIAKKRILEVINDGRK